MKLLINTTSDHWFTATITYIEICKGIYCLPQAGQIANDQSQQHLAKYGYRHLAISNGLWTHVRRDTKFTLVVDNFEVKYTSTEKLITSSMPSKMYAR